MIDWSDAPKTAGGGGIDWSDAPKTVAPPPAAKPKRFHDPGIIRNALAGLQWAANSPVARGADAVLNATSRAGTAAVAGQNPIKSVLNPAGATEVTHAAERNTLGRLGIPQPSTPWLSVPEDFAYETALDPATWVPGLDAFSIGKRALRYAGVGKLAQAAAKTSIGDKVLSGVVEGHDLRKGVTRTGEDIVKGREAAGHNVRSREEKGYADLIEKHRDELEGVETLRNRLQQELAATKMTAEERRGWPPAYVAAQDQKRKNLSKYLGATEDLIPPEIRQATLRRAYLEGTPEVRRKALAAGHVPTAEDRAAPVLNVLHRFESNYEPTQKLFDKEDLAASAGPLRYIKQGNKKAKFDLPKHGGKADDPLADCLLDRLSRGSRIAEYHGTRRNILGDLGLNPQPEIGRTMERIEDAEAAGDTKRFYRYQNLAAKQNLFSQAAEAKRAAALKEDAPLVNQPLEYLDEQTARERSIREAKLAGEDMRGIKPRTSAESLLEKQGRHMANKRAIRVGENFAAVAARGAGDAKKAVGNIAGRFEGNFTRAVGNIKKAAEKQSGRVGALGHALEQHDLVRAAMRSDIPKLHESARQLQAAYIAARKLATVAYKTGLGKDADEIAHRVASERLDKPAGSSLTVLPDEQGGARVLGGRSMGASPYSRSEIAQMLAIIRRSGKDKTATADDARRVLDGAMNAIGEARDKVDRVARDYDIRKAGTSPEGLAHSIEEMRDLFNRTKTEVQGDLARTTGVPTALRKGIARVAAGDKRLGETIAHESTPRQVSLEAAVRPSQNVLKAGQEAVDKLTGSATNERNKLNDLVRKNKLIKDVRADASDAMSERNKVSLPETLGRRLFGDIPQYQEGMLSAFSDLQRDALFVLPYAHKKNITVLAALGPGGVKTVARGIQLARELKTNPDSLADRVRALEQIGATQHYAKEAARGYESLPVVGKPLASFADRSAAALDRYDQGMRLALQEELEKKGVTGFAAGGQIRDVLGDYKNQAPFIKELRRRWGANFPAWGLGIVPRAMTKALREQPRAVKAYARGERLLSDDVTEPAFGADVDVGGPAEDYAKMLEAPWKFVSSRSRLGPVASDLPGFVNAARTGETLPFIGQEITSAIPGASIAGAAANFPYPSNAPSLLRATASLGGSYFPNRPTIKQRTNQLRALGMSVAEIHRALEAEGYFKRTAPPIPSKQGNPFASITQDASPNPFAAAR